MTQTPCGECHEHYWTYGFQNGEPLAICLECGWDVEFSTPPVDMYGKTDTARMIEIRALA